MEYFSHNIKQQNHFYSRKRSLTHVHSQITCAAELLLKQLLVGCWLLLTDRQAMKTVSLTFNQNDTFLCVCKPRDGEPLSAHKR